MSKNFSGLVEVGHSDDGETASQVKVSGKVTADSTIEPDNTRSEHTTGSLYGGSSLTGDIGFLSHADFETLKGFMTDDTEKYWHFHFQDGREVITNIPFNIYVKKTGGANARDGLSAFRMEFEHYSHQPIID